MLDDSDAKMVRRKLQELTAGDPAVQANMLRYVAALSSMVGRRVGEPLQEGDAEVWATFQMSDGEHGIHSVIAGRSRVGRVLLVFDVDDASGPPVAIGVICPEGDDIVSHVDCQLWTPAGGGTALIVPEPSAPTGYFSFVRGRTLRFTQGDLPGDPELGFRRGKRALVSLVRSGQFAHINGGHMHMIKAEGPGELDARSTHISGRWRELNRRG